VRRLPVPPPAGARSRGPRGEYHDLHPQSLCSLSSPQQLSDAIGVRTSSGAAELDASAPDLALQGSYVPAGRGRQGVASTRVFRIRFNLVE